MWADIIDLKVGGEEGGGGGVCVCVCVWGGGRRKMLSNNKTLVYWVGLKDPCVE